MRRRILFLDSLSEIAGGQRVLLQLVPALAAYELHALIPGPGPFSRQLEDIGVVCHYAPMADYTLVQKSPGDMVHFPIDQIVLIRRCRQLVQRYSVDLIYANSTRTFVWGSIAAQWSHRPLIWHLHNIIIDRKTRAMLRVIGRLPMVSRLFTASSEAATVLGCLADRTTVISNGVNTKKFHPDSAAGTRVRTKMGITADDCVIGIVGNLIPLKGQLNVLTAHNALPHPPVCLVVGAARANDNESIDYETELRKHASKRVIFTGRQEDMQSVYNAFDLLIIASERETDQIVLLEGMSCGLPILSTPVGRSSELLPAECIVPVDEPAILATSIHRWIEDRDMCVTLGSRNRRIANDRLSIQRFQESATHEISGLLANH